MESGILTRLTMKSEILTETVNDIYTFSDIHGDIEALLIILEECAQVIKKNPAMPPNEYFFDYDDFYGIMGIKKKEKIGDQKTKFWDQKYDYTMGYTWCGGNKHIVIVGDIIDGMRTGSIKEQSPNPFHTQRCGEYYYEELKILLFLKKMSELAKKQGGRIIRLAGNHEIMALNSDVMFSSQFANNTRYGLIDRKKFFGRTDEDHIFDDDDFAAIIKIHDFVFVHGGLAKQYINDYANYRLSFDSINKNLRDFMYKRDELFKHTYGSRHSLLTERELGYPPELYTEKQILPIPDWTYRDTGNLCNDLYYYFNRLCTMDESDDIECQNHMRLVIGHCPQNFINSSLKQYNMKVYSNINSTLYENADVLTVPVKNMEQDEIDGIIYGMTVECERNENINEPALFRVDVGISKAFDSKEMESIANELQEYMHEQLEKKLNFINGTKCYKLSILYASLMGKLPQALHIVRTGVHRYETSVVRSKLDYVLNTMNRKYLLYNKNDKNSKILKLLILEYHYKFKFTNESEYEISPEVYMQMQEEFSKIPPPVSMVMPHDVEHAEQAGGNYKHKYHKYKAKYLNISKHRH